MIACGEIYADPVETSFGIPTAISRDAGLTVARNPPVVCPPSPAENGPCAQEGAICEYGQSLDIQCNTHFVCEADSTYGNYWSEQSRDTCDTTCPDPSTIVPGAPCTIATEAGTAESGDEAELHCPTETATCACTTGPDGAHAHARIWVCKAPAEDCPTKRPLLGQPCVGEHDCDYGACEFKRGVRMICEQDVWQMEAAPSCD